MNIKKSKLLNLYTIVAVLGCSYSICGCAVYEGITNYFNSTDHFIAFQDDHRIQYEPGAEEFAKAVASDLPSAIDQVEYRQYSKFPGKIIIYVCSSPESFKKLTGRVVAAMTYRKSIFLSPKLLERPGNVKRYLAHELSHLNMYQHAGDYAYLCIPSWFAEGLAAYVSDGGGAEKVSDDEAIDYIISGNHFQPFENAGLRDLFVPRYASYWGIKHRFKHHMYYRQCMLFVNFLEKEDPEGFKKFIIDLQKRMDFSDAFRTAFGADTMTKWHKFKNQIIMTSAHLKMADHTQ
jgi:hypothetical protein